ncbi:2-dehydropantoate 2-reductase [Rubrivivax rivuli]|uniref:2-dehydropantoate 2-reductase n=1 Tax=Rubrivivax rivuli TaxID=1862385 RepID=A0A437RLS2_9BURK|nr:2-dehydropantoate 2-reductase [Rubrivivax rivuli]RVU47562.1 2-dehydropantoate 2-reductase [Rubrivivax rivuli]
MKVCIVGLGAIGGLFAARLGQRLPPGEVTLSALARGATLAAVRQHGLRVHGPEGITAIPLPASDDPAALGVQDLVIVAVKGPALPAVAPAVAALCGLHTRVLAAMNGVPWWFFEELPGPCRGLVLQSVDPGAAVRALLPAARVLGGVVNASATAPAPGEVRPVMGQGLVIGEAGTAADDGASLQAVATVLERAGFDVTRSAQVQREVWFKLWGNMTMNPVSALTGAPCDRILDDDLVRGFCSAVMREAQAIGAAFGIPIDQAPEARHAVTRKLGSFKTSMLQDAEAGRPLELDALLGAVREIGAHLGQATPNIDALFGLVRLMARQRGLYPATLNS